MVIVNADDFGRSRGVNRGVIRAHEDGVVTSASLMVRWPAATEAAEYCRQRPSLDLGIHLDLGEWVYRDTTWEPVYEVVPVDSKDEVAAEVEHQLDIFRRLVGRNPTHMDSHQHVHRHEPVRSAAFAAAASIDVPLRDCDPRISYSGMFYGQGGKGEPWPAGISLDALLRIIAALPEGVTELGCHPGDGDDFSAVYREERLQELRVLCDPRVREALSVESVQLTSFTRVTRGLEPTAEDDVTAV